MKSLNMVSKPTVLDVLDKTKLGVIPAKLKDESGEVYEDKLYSFFTISTEINNSDIDVQLLITDLVKHTFNGEKKYWVGIGINNDVITGSTAIYSGIGLPQDTNLGNPITLVGEQEAGGVIYKTFYIDAESAKNNKNCKAFIVVVKGGVHYHYIIDFSKVSLKESQEQLEPMSWTQMSVKSVKDNYLFGIDLSDANGNPLPEGLFVHYINSAVEYLQNLLDITISDTECVERHDYIRSDYQNWGFIQLDHNPVKEVKRLTLMYGNQRSMEIPLDWIQLNKLTGQITLFPSAGSANSLIIGQTGMLFGFQSQWSYAPQLWEVEYTAGIDENDKTMPLALLKEAVAKRASCGILNVWGDLIIGAGIASQSVSIDGISQSIGTTQSAMFGGASARVSEYTKDLKEGILPVLRQKFGGLRLVVV